MATRTTVELDKVGPLVDGHFENPFDLLGPHEIVTAGRRALAVRAFLPESSQAWVVDPRENRPHPMRRIHPAGLFEAICPSETPNRRYLLRVADQRGTESMMHDPYAFPPLLSELDLHLLGEGKHWRSYDEAGRATAHRRRCRGGQLRRLGAQRHGRQRARRFQRLERPPPPDAQAHSQRHLGTVRARPGCRGTLYKYQVRHRDQAFEKADPYGFAAEVPPRTASKVADLDRYQWHDVEWMANRQRNGARMLPFRSTKSTWEAGGVRAMIRAAGSTTASWPTSWSTTAKRWATRTSS